MSQPLANNHISVDCVVMGFDGEEMGVLLLHRTSDVDGVEVQDMKLPGSLIYQDEDLDDAAKRVLLELTGVSNVDLMQFKAFGSKDRTRAIRDVIWLERAQQCRVERIVTIAYLALMKIDRSITKVVEQRHAKWVPLKEVQSLQLAFDHNLIIEEAIKYVRNYVESEPSVLFDLLPRKFTAAQLRMFYEMIYGKAIDVRNFHKKLLMMKYVVALEERQKGVAHRAARYYRFDRVAYNKSRR